MGPADFGCHVMWAFATFAVFCVVFGGGLSCAVFFECGVVFI